MPRRQERREPNSLGLFLVGAPDGASGAGVADGARLVHGAEGQRVVDTAKKAGHLHQSAIRPRCDRYVPHAAATDPSRARDRSPSTCVDGFQGHSG
jgi:hypothetical protein